jgi:hypothetical protein
LIAVACLVACGGSSSQDVGSGSSGTDGGQTAPDDAGTPGDGGPQQIAPFFLGVQIQGSGEVRSSPAGIDCTAACHAAPFNPGTVVQLTATPAGGQQFTGWSGACGGTGSCTLTVERDLTVIANFQPVPKLHTLTVSTWAGGTVASSPFGLTCLNGTCTGSFAEGTQVELTVLPRAGAQFFGWSGACFGTTPCSLTVATDLTARANFDFAPVPDTCVSVLPGEAPMEKLIRQFAQTSFTCLPGMADSSGALAFPRLFSQGSNLSGTSIDFLASDGNPQEVTLSTGSLRPVQQTFGLSLWGGSAAAGQVLVDNFDSTGDSEGAQAVLLGSNVAAGSEAVDGIILAGDFKTRPVDSPVHSVVKLNGGDLQAGFRWGPVPLASSGAVFGTGQDLFGNSIVITSGAAKFGEGTISAQWFNVDGTALTGEFLLLQNFVPGSNTWFETSALIGGGVMVRRMDQPSASTTHAQAMVTLESGTANPKPAPGWMTARPDMRMKIVRGRRAYAFLPYGAPNTTCSQTLEVVSSSGGRCGSASYPIADGTCDTLPLMLGEDGTVIQQLPTSMETSAPGSNSCTWRWWKGVLR